VVQTDKQEFVPVTSLHLKLVKTFSFPSLMKCHFVRHFFTLYHTDEGESKPTIKYNKSSTPFMHECVMMSEHLVHYLRSLAAKFNAAKFQAIAHQRRNSGDKMSAEALRRWGMSALEDDKEALHTWNTV